jgi:predicted nucleic acid-binding protein
VEKKVREKTLVDTGFVIALVNKRDQFHAQAKELASQFDGQPLLVLTFDQHFTQAGFEMITE